jgi:hypothetical protein
MLTFRNLRWLGRWLFAASKTHVFRPAFAPPNELAVFRLNPAHRGISLHAGIAFAQ